MSRLESNLGLVKLLEDYLTKNPDIRFHQAMWNLGIITNDSQYNEEPSETLKRSLDGNHEIKLLKNEIENKKQSLLKQYSIKDGSYYSKPSEVRKVLSKIFKRTDKTREGKNE
jgi:hypothetical protein